MDWELWLKSSQYYIFPHPLEYHSSPPWDGRSSTDHLFCEGLHHIDLVVSCSFSSISNLRVIPFQLFILMGECTT